MNITEHPEALTEIDGLSDATAQWAAIRQGRREAFVIADEEEVLSAGGLSQAEVIENLDPIIWIAERI